MAHKNTGPNGPIKGSKSVALGDLKARAKKARAGSHEYFRLSINIQLELYAQIIDMAERYRRTPQQIAKFALEYGVTRYQSIRADIQPVPVSDIVPERINVNYEWTEPTFTQADSASYAKDAASVAQERAELAGFIPRSPSFGLNDSPRTDSIRTRPDELIDRQGRMPKRVNAPDQSAEPETPDEPEALSEEAP